MIVAITIHCVSKRPTFKLSVTLPNLKPIFKNFALLESVQNSLQNRYKITPSHLRHVATLPWEIKNFKFSADVEENAKQCIFIVSNFVILPQIVIFSVFKIASLSSYRLQIKIFPCHCSCTYLLLRSICGIGNSSQQTSLQHLSTTNMVFSDEDKILIKTFVFEGVHSKEVDRRIS